MQKYGDADKGDHTDPLSGKDKSATLHGENRAEKTASEEDLRSVAAQGDFNAYQAVAHKST